VRRNTGEPIGARAPDFADDKRAEPSVEEFGWKGGVGDGGVKPTRVEIRRADHDVVADEKGSGRVGRVRSGGGDVLRSREGVGNETVGELHAGDEVGRVCRVRGGEVVRQGHWGIEGDIGG